MYIVNVSLIIKGAIVFIKTNPALLKNINEPNKNSLAVKKGVAKQSRIKT